MLILALVGLAAIFATAVWANIYDRRHPASEAEKRELEIDMQRFQF